MILDRLPERRIRRVVDDHDAFEIRIVEPGDRIERGFQHLRRLEISGYMDRDFREAQVAAYRRRHGRRALDDQTLRLPAKGDGRDFLDPRHRNQHQRHEQDQAERQGERRAEDEIVPGPVGKHGGSPRADPVGRGRECQRLQHGRLRQPQDRQRHQDADEHRDGGKLPVVRIDDRARPAELRLPRGVQDSPIRTDAAFEEFPGLINRLDDVVVHADGLGPRDEIAEHRGLLERTGHGIAQVIARARPTEFRDHDPLAGKLVAQQLEHGNRLIHRLLVGEVFPVWQDVGGDEIDGISQIRKIAPDIPDFASRDGDVDRLLDPLDEFNQVFDFLVAAVDRLVADHHPDDVAVAPCQIDRRIDLALVALGILVDPGADRHLEAEFGRDRRNQFDATGGGIEADRARNRRQLPQIVANLLNRRDVIDVRMRGSFKRRIGHAGQDSAKVRCLLFFLKKTPKRSVSGGNQQQNGDDGAHRN